MVYIIKANGEKEKFDKHKVYRTCFKAGADERICNEIADYVENKVYEGIKTKKIFELVYRKLSEYSGDFMARYKLREAIARLNPENNEFEKYICRILKFNGYQVEWNRIIQGVCIEHQIDCIAVKDRKKYLVECKHHIKFHRCTDLDVVMKCWAVLEDIINAYRKRIIDEKFDNIWVIVNTKFSEHAKKYARAKRLKLTGWNYPPGESLSSLISDKICYPITILTNSDKIIERFTKSGILTLGDLLETRTDRLQKKLNLSQRTIEKYKKLAENI
ncbi:MAG: hypothetical protein B6U88_01375 [Candidatus Aenigmarchaeota archaeon ex4484_56]|nr:MAG: hypothetical protein B6U88_01375 [Candidatus Aenigmarchaeota archaeon ex4484_56]